jgi:hypothetical protein
MASFSDQQRRFRLFEVDAGVMKFDSTSFDLLFYLILADATEQLSLTLAIFRSYPQTSTDSFRNRLNQSNFCWFCSF